MKKGDKVQIISAPVVDNNEYGQMQINTTVGQSGTIENIYANGIRNILVYFDKYAYNYYSAENLKLIPKN